MSQTGRATVLLMYKFAFLFSDEVVAGSVATITTLVTDLCVVSLEGLVLFDTIWNIQQTNLHKVTTGFKTLLYQFSGAPNVTFRTISVRKTTSRIFGTFVVKISCLPASPRIFEHLKNGLIAHF